MSDADTALASSDAADRLPLSFNQEFLCVFDKGPAEGAFGQRHTLVHGWRLAGEVDPAALQGALDDVVTRHEVLRTTIHRADGVRYQEVNPATSPNLEVRDLGDTAPDARDTRAEEFLNELDGTPFSVDELPHLRAVLGRFDDTDSVLVIITHHTATDGWSMEVLIRDLAACYAARRGHGDGPAAEVHQYHEFAAWQLGSAGTDSVQKLCGYWRDKLQGAQIVGVKADRPRTPETPALYGAHRFLVDPELTSATLKASRTMRSSPFMVLLAAYNALLHARTGATDVVVPTLTSGRSQERFMETVGPFFNFVPLRTDLGTCETFRDVVDRTRTSCIEIFSNDIPFALIVNEAPELTTPFADPSLAVIAFEVLQSPSTMDSELIGDLKYSEIRRRVLSQDVSSGIPDGILWAMDVLPSGEIAGSVKYDVNVFDEATVAKLAADYCDVLRNGVGAPDSPLRRS